MFAMDIETHFTPLALEWGNIDQILWDDKNLIPIVPPIVHHSQTGTQSSLNL